MSASVPFSVSPVSAGRLRKSTAVVAAALTGLAVGGLTLTAGVAQAATAPVAASHTYYVSPSGNDANSGASDTAPWRTVNKVNRTVLHPGDSVLFSRGGTWTDRLILKQSGTATAPITVKAYGTGALPTFQVGVSSECVRVQGDYTKLSFLATDGCHYAGFNVLGHYDSVNNSIATNNVVGIKVSKGASFNGFQHDLLVNNNRMSVNTIGIGCGHPHSRFCDDDSGATAVLINGDDNNFGYNDVSGSVAYSYDYGYDGSAFEIFNANRNVIHDNVSTNNLVLSELGRSNRGTSAGNVYRRNTVTANCGIGCNNAGGVTLRGDGVSWGPTNDTIIDGNTFDLVGSNTQGISCAYNCPTTTQVTDNVISAKRVLWMDGSGWTLSGNSLNGASTAHIGTQNYTILKGHTMYR